MLDGDAGVKTPAHEDSGSGFWLEVREPPPPYEDSVSEAASAVGRDIVRFDGSEGVQVDRERQLLFIGSVIIKK